MIHMGLGGSLAKVAGEARLEQWSASWLGEGARGNGGRRTWRLRWCKESFIFIWLIHLPLREEGQSDRGKRVCLWSCRPGISASNERTHMCLPSHGLAGSSFAPSGLVGLVYKQVPVNFKGTFKFAFWVWQCLALPCSASKSWNSDYTF